jgi:CHASE1-domain containing sensor protein
MPRAARAPRSVMIGSMHVYLPINREEKTENATASSQHKHLVLTSILSFHRFLTDAVGSLSEADNWHQSRVLRSSRDGGQGEVSFHQ